MKNPFGTTKTAIRHIAVPQSTSDIFATAEFAENTTLWSLHQRKKLAEVRTVLDFGGTRLALVQDGKLLLLAAKFHGPIEAYDSKSSVLWSRKDLTGIQQLIHLSGAAPPAFGVGLEDQPYRILNPLDGREVGAIKDVREIYSSPFTTRVLYVTADKSVCLAELNSTRFWQQPIKSFGVLHAAFSPDQVAYSEVGGEVVCFDLHGRQKWRASPEKNHHFLRVAWNRASGKWMAIDWDYENGGPKRLFEINKIGNRSLVADLHEAAETEFFATGDHLVTSNGDVIDVSSGQVVWNFLRNDKT